MVHSNRVSGNSGGYRELFTGEKSRMINYFVDQGTIKIRISIGG